MLRPLAQDQPDSARRRVDEDGVSGLRAEDTVDDQGGGETFHHHARGLPLGDPGGQLDQPLCRDIARLGISAGRFEEFARHPGIGDAIARRIVVDTSSDRFDHAGGLIAENQRKRERPRQIEAAAAHVDVGIIDADRGVANARFAGTRRRNVDFLPMHHFRAAIGVNADRLCHGRTGRALLRKSKARGAQTPHGRIRA